MITYPKIRNPDSGICLSKGRYLAYYTVNGKRRQRLLGTSDVAEARIRRDAFYAALKADGGTESQLGAPTRDERYVYRRKPFFVKIRGRYVGDYDTVDEALAARDAAVEGGAA